MTDEGSCNSHVYRFLADSTSVRAFLGSLTENEPLKTLLLDLITRSNGGVDSPSEDDPELEGSLIDLDEARSPMFGISGDLEETTARQAVRAIRTEGDNNDCKQT